MSFLDRFLPRRFVKAKPALTPDIITELAAQTRAKIDAESPRPFVAAYRNFRQYRRDAGIRRELAKTRAYNISSRPREPQHSLKVVTGNRAKMECSNGQVLVGIDQKNPILRDKAMRFLYRFSARD